jgi:hypothetical protein
LVVVAAEATALRKPDSQTWPASSASLAVSSGIQPQFAAGDLDITED